MSYSLRAEAKQKLRERQKKNPKITYDEFRYKYRKKPKDFVHDCFIWREGEGPSDYQNDILKEFNRHRRMAIRGPHGLGKTALAAWLIIWFCLTRDEDEIRDWKVAVTASVWRQLTKFLMPEVHKWIRRIDWSKIGRKPFNENTELLTLNIKLKTGEMFCLASKEPTALEGVHADSVLYILDESKAIQDEIWNSVERAFSTGNEGYNEVFVLAISTPGAEIGRFFEIHSKKAGYEDWHTKHVTLEDAIKAGRISREWAEQRKRQWGEKSAPYQNRVLGEFAADDSTGVIPYSWISLANQRWELWDEEGRPGTLLALGVDVAGATKDSDDTVLAPVYTNYKVGDLEKHPEGNIDTATMEVAGYVKGYLDANKQCIPIIDTIGIGTGVADRLAEQGYKLRRFIASEKTDAKDESGKYGFVNKRAAMWWKVREMLSPDSQIQVALPPDPDLTRELTTPKWFMMSGARYKVESKADIKKRINKSTDCADAVLQGLVGLELCEEDNWEVESGNLQDMMAKLRRQNGLHK